MESMAISEFKARCLAIIERVRKSGEPVLITRRGEPVAQIVPPPPPEHLRKSAFGCMKGTAEELEDIVAPLPREDWGSLA